MVLLNGEPVICLSGEEFLPKEGMTFIEQVSDFFSKQGRVANSPFGEVTLDKKGIKNDMAHGIGRLKACSFAAIKDVLENGVVINPMKQYHTNQKKNPTGMIAAPIMIGDEKYVCVVEVIANRQINRLYVHEVTLTKNLQGDVADSNAVHRDNNLVTHPQGEIAKVLQNYITANKSQENNSETNENKQYKTRYNMKKTIRLTESDLHRVIKESVKRILKEAAYNGNHVGRDNGNGRFEMTHPEGKYSLYFDKAQRDAHNYNAQQQGQIPNPYAGWSKRVNDGNGNWSDAEFNGEDMHMYKDDDATTTAQNLRQYDPNGAYHWDMFRGHGDQYRQS